MIPNHSSDPTLPRLMRIPDACMHLGIGRTKLYDLVGHGLIEVVKIGSATRVKTESMERFVASLPSNITVSTKQSADPAIESCE